MENVFFSFATLSRSCTTDDLEGFVIHRNIRTKTEIFYYISLTYAMVYIFFVRYLVYAIVVLSISFLSVYLTTKIFFSHVLLFPSVDKTLS